VYYRRWNHFLADIVDLVIYSLSYVTFFVTLAALVARGDTVKKICIRSIVLAYGVDIFETIGILILMYSYPLRLSSIAVAVSWLTTIKFTLFAAYIVTLVIGFPLNKMKGSR
jgi:hypothetical protein